MKVSALVALLPYSAFAQNTTTAQVSGCVVTFRAITQDALKKYVERLQGDGSFKVLQTFQQKGLYNTYANIPLGGRSHHPAHAVIEDAVKWLSGSGLTIRLRAQP